ncbi:hypothetical protein [Thorsellia kenyensis]|uniref:Uncharacterized protein n=1 Tax=Thorsellia kenyensis TaxID=1549888 RepID=A0ABV6CEK8_9GAMM
MNKKYIVLMSSILLSTSALGTSILYPEQPKDAHLSPKEIEQQQDLTGGKNKDAELIHELSKETALVEGPSPHLTFHMGLSAEGQNFVGGSIENKGKVSVHGGYIVILPLDEKCNPLNPILHEFGKIGSGEILPFRAPVEQPLSAYRVIGFNAFDDMGFPIDSVDDTVQIITKRMPEERKACEAKRIQ